MRRYALLTLCLSACPLPAADEKGVVMDFGGLKSTTPAKWVKEKPSGSMRLAQFKVPKVAGDKEDAYVVVFPKIGGSAKANVDRWKGQMGGGDGKVTELKIAGHEATRLEIEGTYTGASLDGKSKGVTIKGAKGIFYLFAGPDDTYAIRFIGPAKTVEANAKDFDAWMKGFKK
ncbi:MAG: hypothetical protein K2W96_03980 [Gemmataceae bacterium]|nr:hypothetical protein [Gemmataceae bacterium]